MDLPRGLSRCLLVASVLLALVLAGCGEKDEPAQAAASERVTVRIASFQYRPATVRVKAGGRVTWVNEDRAAHTATAERAGAFDTDKLERGDARAVTLDKPGTYRYYCVFHRFMQADLIVVE
jgi:plastocyanin